MDIMPHPKVNRLPVLPPAKPRTPQPPPVEVREPAAKKKAPAKGANKIAVECQECEKRFNVSPNAKTGPECPRCGSVDIEPVEPAPVKAKSKAPSKKKVQAPSAVVLSPREESLIAALWPNNHAAGTLRVERMSERQFDIEISGPTGEHTSFSAWVPLAAIATLEWWKAPIASRTDYPDMALAGDWSAVRDTERSSLWGIFEDKLPSLLHWASVIAASLVTEEPAPAEKKSKAKVAASPLAEAIASAERQGISPAEFAAFAEAIADEMLSEPSLAPVIEVEWTPAEVAAVLGQSPIPEPTPLVPEVPPPSTPVPVPAAPAIVRSRRSERRPAEPAVRPATPFGGIHSFAAPPRTVDEAMRLAGLDWEVGKVPLDYVFQGERRQSDARAIIRMDTGSHLGTGTERFEPLQNRDAFSVFQPLLDEGLMTFESAGCTMGGKTVFVMAKLLRPDILIREGDAIGMYVLLSHGHGIGRAICFGPTPRRLWCTNQLATLSGSPTMAKIAHTLNAKNRLDELVGLCDSAAQAIEQSAGAYRCLALAPMPPEGAYAYVSRYLALDNPAREGAYTPSEGSDAVTAISALQRQTATRAQRLLSLIQGGIGNDGRTWWSAVNGITEFATWEGGSRSDDTRIDSLLFGRGAGEIGAALDIAIEMSGIEVA